MVPVGSRANSRTGSMANAGLRNNMRLKTLHYAILFTMAFHLWPPHAAHAETTIASYDELTEKQQGTLVEAVIQNFVDNLQSENRDGAAQCIVQLYTNPLSGSKIGLSAGMEEFFKLVDVARRSDPTKTSIERIVVYQAGKHCSRK